MYTCNTHRCWDNVLNIFVVVETKCREGYTFLDSIPRDPVITTGLYLTLRGGLSYLSDHFMFI